MFACDIAARYVLVKFSEYLRIDFQFNILNNTHYQQLLLPPLQMGILSDILIIIFIPIYICLLRPHIHRCIPGMLKRIGLGVLLLTVSLLCDCLIDTAGHIQERRSNVTVCFIKQPHLNQSSLSISALYLVISYTLNSLSYLFFYIAAFEFMCAQSPHAMKGLIIGTFFAIKGTFQFLGATILYVPFFSWSLKTSFPSCGFVYYLINILVALSGLVAYTYVARRYQYRQRDEPDNVYRYAEDYYDRAIDERLQSSYDYSNDIDNLNVHTVDK